MECTEAVKRRLEVREFTDEPVSEEIKRSILGAARLSPSSKNRQNWHFLLVDDDALDELAAASATGRWVADAAFAVVVLTGDYPSHGVDVGRSVSHMQFAAWDQGVGSCIYTGVDGEALTERFGVPERFVDGAVVGFGYPEGSGTGRKQRRPLEDVASRNRFGEGL